jgi:hypothetical protein
MLKKKLFGIAAEMASEPATDMFMQAFQDCGWDVAIVASLLSFCLVFGEVYYSSQKTKLGILASLL